MIRAAFSSAAGAWIAKNVERGEIPEKLAVPLTILATRLPTPVILAGAIGYGLYRLNQERRAMPAKDVTPKRRARPAPRRGKSSSVRKRPKAKRTQTTSSTGAADV